MVQIIASRSLSEEDRVRIAGAGAGVEVLVAPDEHAVVPLLGRAEVLFGGHFSRNWLSQSPCLRWVQVGSAGVDRMPLDAFRERGVRLTNASGVFDLPIAEHLLAMILAHARRLPVFRDQQRLRQWQREPFNQGADNNRGNLGPDQVAGKVLGILGMGSIGGALAERGHALGMRVLGLKRRPVEVPSFVERLLGPESLDVLLRESDYLALTLPLTPATHHILDARGIGLMKPTAVVLNIGRGALVDEQALTDALNSGRLGGAGLDVFETEPLPAHSLLWEMPQVIVTPHVAGNSTFNHQRLMDLFCANLAAYLKSEPMPTEVNLEAGY